MTLDSGAILPISCWVIASLGGGWKQGHQGRCCCRSPEESRRSVPSGQIRKSKLDIEVTLETSGEEWRGMFRADRS